MRTRTGKPARLVATIAGGLVALTLVAAAGGSPGSLRNRQEALRAQNAALAARSGSAVLELYALDSRLAGARSEVDALRTRAEALRRERAAVLKRLAIAKQAVALAQRHLADHVRFLYVQGETDPLAILLGASSLNEAITQLDALQRTASLNEDVIEQASAAQRRLLAASKALAHRTAEVERLEAQAVATARALERARAQRAAYIASLTRERSLNEAAIGRLEAQARAAEVRSSALAVAPSAAPSTEAAPAPAQSGQTLTVTATGYSLQGSTATGIPAGWGVVAVDPGLIPLGTRLTIPGYGEGIAADIGSGVQGATIDLWFPTDAQAQAWGRRAVTVTLH